MALTPSVVESLEGEIQSLLEMWMRVKLAFVKAYGDAEITPELERGFMQIKTELSAAYRNIEGDLVPGLKFDGEKMAELMKNAINMRHVRRQPTADRTTTFVLWHRIYVKLTRALGALKVIRSGYYPSIHRHRLRLAAVGRKN